MFSRRFKLQPVFYVSNVHPRSHNRGGSNAAYKSIHSTRFNTKYLHLYSNLPTSETNLESKIVYIHHNIRYNDLLDVDNISKPIIDAFTGVIYDDDKQIISRVARRIDLNDLVFVTIDMTEMPTEIATDLNDFIQNQEKDIILLSVNKINLSDIKIGEI